MSEIRDDIPPPKERGKKYKFTQLQPGQSVLEDKPDDVGAHTFIMRVRAAMQYHSKTTGQQFITRAEGESIRVWRVS